MPDNERPKIHPPLKCTFDQVYEKILSQPETK